MTDDHLPAVAQASDEETHSPFERIRHADEQGDYWLARELMPLLEYNKWQDFEDAVQRAVVDCAKSGRSADEHFHNFTRSRKVSSRGPGQKEYRLTRYACNLVVMTARTTGAVAAQARTYFSDTVEAAEAADALATPTVEEAEVLVSPDVAYLTWRTRAIQAFIAEGYSPEWSERRVDDLVARNALTHEWSVRGITDQEYPVLTNRLHMGAFGLSIEEHKGAKGFAVTYKGKKLVFKGNLPPAMTLRELTLNALASDVARELHVKHDSQGFEEIAGDVDVAGRIVGDTRRQIEAVTGTPVVSPRNMIREPDGGLWALLPTPDDARDPGDDDA